jgi:hypothetical protein
LLLAGSAGIRYWLARVQAGLALARLRGGGTPDRDQLLATLEQARAGQEAWLVPRCLEALAEAALAAGDAPAALAHAGELLALAAGGPLRDLERLGRGLQRRAAARG